MRSSISNFREPVHVFLRCAVSFIELAMRVAFACSEWPSNAFLVGCTLLSLRAADGHAAEILISKSDRTLQFSDGHDPRTFPIALGLSPTGPKTRRGDHRTPEGDYFVTHKNPKSQFYLSLGISYPNAHDAAVGYKTAVISETEYVSIKDANTKQIRPLQNTGLGGDVFIHGGGATRDWTWGCIALDDEDMRFLFQNASVGDKVKIVE